MEWLHQYGSAIIFLLALADGLNLPVPSSAVLLAAGGMVAQGELNLAAVLLASISGVFLGNLPWYLLGRRMGPRVLIILCKVSLNASSCIGRMEAMYRKYGAASLVGARFIPGLAAIAPPLAGASGLSPRRYMVFDLLGAVVFCVTLVVGGTFFGGLWRSVRENPPSPQAILTTLGAAVFLVLLYKVVMRIKHLYLAVPRITPEELKAKLDAGEEVVILDARAEAMRQLPPWRLPGAVYQANGGKDALVVTYCECPFEASAALIAKTMKAQQPAMRVCALKGGMSAWESRGYALEPT